MNCPICTSAMSEPVQELFALPSITSDCRPYKSGRSVKICTGCGVMHRVTNADFSDVYDCYVSYPEPTGRTAKILDFVADKMPEPKSVLDVGCGQGVGLDILKEKFPLASVHGYDPYSKDFKEKPRSKFDLITLFHVLEHVEDLHEMLAYIKSSLTDNGHVLIQVPYITMWPFDLILADHWWHFTQKSLIILLADVGFHPVYIGNDIIKKEITVLAKFPAAKGTYAGEPFVDYTKSINWLLSYKKFLDTINEPVAVMGTGPAAAWAGSVLGDKVQYYLDDDLTRLGILNGKSVLVPKYCKFPIVSPFPDWQLPAIKEKHPNLRFL